MRYGLIGEKLGHSFSAEIHRKLAGYEYELKELPPQRLEAFIREKDFDGINVTIPYKQAVMPLLDELSERSKATGAVNTIVNRGGRLLGDNTDFGGLEALIRRMGLEVKGKTVLVAGSGGTAGTASAVARALGAAEVIRLSRSGRGGAMSYEQACREKAYAQLLINATPAGMYPDVDGIPVRPELLPGLEGVVDAVYNPLTTRLVRQARKLGIRAENGLYMLVAQAAMSAGEFIGKSFDDETVERICREIMFEKRNIVLTGMPGSGKSTVGRLLAERLGRELTDTDAEIVKREKMPISEIFEKRGEGYFRELESRVIKESSLTGGRIISTGGGAVLRAENIDAMKMNGTVVFLDRAESELIPTKDRPLADDAEKIRTLYRQRYHIYKETADCAVIVRGTPQDTANEITEMLQ